MLTLISLLLSPLMLLKLLRIPLVVLSLFGGIVSGIWLAVLGEWWAILTGIPMSILGHLGIGLAMMPIAIIFVPLAILLTKKGKLISGFLFMALNLTWILFIVSAWCLLVSYFFLSRANAETVWPLLIWSYGVALAPIMYLTVQEQKAGESYPSIITAGFAQLAYITSTTVSLFTPITFLDHAKIFGGVMAIGLLALLTYGMAMLLEQKRQKIRNPFK